MFGFLTFVMAVSGALTAPVRADEPRPALLRIAHLSPDTPAVDVSMARAAAAGQVLTDPGTTVAADLAYGAVGEYRQVVSGAYAVSVRGAGAATAPVLSIRVDLEPGQARTVVLAGAFADLGLEVLDDDLTAPPSGSARVRVLDASSGRPGVEVALDGGPTLASDLALGDAGAALTVPGGRHRATVTGSATAQPLDLRAGAVLTLLVLDAPGGGTTLRAVVDAAGPAELPRGGVAAGGIPRLPGTALRLLLASLTGAASSTAATQRSAPLRLTAPSVGIDAPLTVVGLDAGGTLLPPADPSAVGWFSGGPLPGDTGPAVLTGHVDWAGRPGALHRLHTIPLGAEIDVARADGTQLRFRVTAVDRYAKDAFPTGRVYGPASAAELRLITCGGPFDRGRGSYRDNVVVSATAV
ncbi:hypothetical protein DQ237_08230 [Blastococcus sp. TF02-8]|uniref:class F sortase n=1 Tax=Blastococcus sp. TF02-8 TaxID=2250574 RepID=UPI000DEB19BD|nr:class F sortase [Blastococcus sp. TF02-8]RBY96605.1 hypothetical protein DQ237_08230 [Blastococcus sp. TF02-8]